MRSPTANADKTLTLYGRPGGSYAVESRRTMAPTDPWAFLQRFPLTNRYRTFPVAALPPTAFYRAYEFQAEPPLFDVGALAHGGSLLMLVYGKPGVNYTLKRAVLVEGVPAWTDVLSFTIVNSWQFIELPGTSAYSLCRIRQNPTVSVRLDMLGASGSLATLRLHGKSGTNYIIEVRTSLGTNVAGFPSWASSSPTPASR